MEEQKFTWKVILKWATASEATHFPGPKFPIVITNTGTYNMHIYVMHIIYRGTCIIICLIYVRVGS